MRLLPAHLLSLRSAALVTGALATLVYANSLENDFAYDDLHIIHENPGIHSLQTLPGALTEPYWPGRFGRELGLWRPTTTAFLGLQYALSGENATLYHVINVLAHGAVSVLVLLLLVELMPLAAAFAAGLVFAVHPVHVEAVANVIGIAELLATGFLLWACLLHVRGPEQTGWGRALAMGGLYALAFGAKEIAVTLPGAIFLLDAARQRLGFHELPDYLRRRWRAYLVMLVVAITLLFLRWHVLGSIASPLSALGADLLEEIPRIWTVAEVWMHYVRLWVFPMDLSADYAPDVIPISIGWHGANLVGLGMGLLVLVGTLVAWRRPEMVADRDTARAAAFGVVWFMITVSPVSNVLFLSGVLLAERTLYLPSVGLAAATGWLVVRVARERPRAAWVALFVALSLGSWRTWTRNPTWRDNLTVFGQLIEDYPHSGRSQWVLGDLFFQQGRVSEAMVSYRAAVNILGPHYRVISEISSKLIGAERYDSAERLLRFIWRDHPELSTAPGLIAVIYSERGMPEETERYCRAALAIDDTDAVQHHLLAWALAEQGRWEEAAEARRGAIAQGEGHSWQQWVSLAYLEAHAGDTASATVALDSARLVATTRASRAQIDSLRAEMLGPPASDADTGRVGR